MKTKGVKMENIRCTKYFDMFGYNKKDIAKIIGVSPPTISYHLESLKKKHKQDKVVARLFLSWIKNKIDRNSPTIDSEYVLSVMEKSLSEYLSGKGELNIKKSKKKRNIVVSKIEFNGVDLTERDKIDEINNLCSDVSQLCEDYIYEEETYEETQKGKIKEIKELLSRLPKILN